MFLLGRAMSGKAAGLAVACFTVVSQPLVDWSRNAYPPSIFLLMLTLSVYCCYRGFVEGRAGLQVAGAGFFLLAVVSYEFAVLVPAGLALYLALCTARRQWSWYRGWPSLLALGLIAVGLAVFWAITLALRAGTLAGPLGEVSTFLTPGWRVSGARFYWENVFSSYGALVILALVGVLLLHQARHSGAGLIFGLWAVALALPIIVVQNKYVVSYALPALLLTTVLAAVGGVYLGKLLGRALPAPSLFRGALPCFVLFAIFGLALSKDAAFALDGSYSHQPDRTWVQTFRREGLRSVFSDEERRSNHLIVAVDPLLVEFYLGRPDFYIDAHPRSSLRYAYAASDGARSIHTNSLLLHQSGDFQRLFEGPNAGKTIWFLGEEGDLRRKIRAIDPELLQRLLSAAERQVRTRDGWLLLRLTLPPSQGETYPAHPI
jgi:hypothetical protein